MYCDRLEIYQIVSRTSYSPISSILTSTESLTSVISSDSSNWWWTMRWCTLFWGERLHVPCYHTKNCSQKMMYYCHRINRACGLNMPQLY